MNEANPNLTSNVLTQFKNTIEEYDGYAIRVFTQHTTISTQGQQAAFCIHKEEIGISCGVVKAVSDGDVDTFETYWLPVSKKGELDGSTLAFNTSLDSAKVTGALRTLQYYKIGTSGASAFQADKYLLAEQESYTGLKDYRFANGDTVDIYRMNKAAGVDGAIVWDAALQRQLKGALAGLSSFGAALSIAIYSLLF